MVVEIMHGRLRALRRLVHVTAAAEACGPRCLSTWRREVEGLREASQGGELRVLGIESSCDDTGVALLNESGCVLGEAIHSQLQTHKQ